MDFEHNINTAVNRLREALGDDTEQPRFIETLPRLGYRFIAPMSSPAMAVAVVSDRRTAVVTPPLQERRRLAMALAGAVLLVGTAVTYWFTHRPPPHAPMTERRLTTKPSENPVNQGSISPDGKYLAYSDQTGMHLKSVQAGETFDVPQPAGPGPSPSGWWPSGWFPDSTKVLATGVEPGPHYSAWVVSVLGGLPHRLCDNASAWSVSPDGSLILIKRAPGSDGLGDLAVMGVQGEEPHTLVARSQDASPYRAVWSPDGQRVAYDIFRHTPHGNEHSIESRDLKGGQPSVIVSDPETAVFSFWWFSNGYFVYSKAEPTLGPDRANLWEVQVDPSTGAPAGAPRQITHWEEGYANYLNGTADGKQLAVTKHGEYAYVSVGNWKGRPAIKEPASLDAGGILGCALGLDAGQQDLALLVHSQRNVGPLQTGIGSDSRSADHHRARRQGMSGSEPGWRLDSISLSSHPAAPCAYHARAGPRRSAAVGAGATRN